MNKKIFSLIFIAVLGTCLISGVSAVRADADIHDQPDQFESFNRAMFKFNYQVDRFVLKPLAKGYRAITNETIRERVRSVISNLREPISFGNQILQGEFKQAGVTLGRFAVNSTLGLAGMFDVAGGWGWQRKKDGFDATLAKWCVKDGPFIVLPFLGPSTPRAFTGMVGDFFMDPVNWVTYESDDDTVKYAVGYGYYALGIVALRESSLELTDELEKGSVDYYATMRSAYLQNRNKNSCYGDSENNATSYDFDFGEDEEDQTYQEMEEAQ